MSELTIDVTEYLTHEEIQGIVEDEYRRAVCDYFRRGGVEQKLANMLYYTAFNIMDEVFKENDRDLRAEIKKAIEKAITDYPGFYVFRRKDDIINEKNSPAQDILEEEEMNARPLIRKKVEEAIEKYNFDSITHDEVCEELFNAIHDKLFGREASGNQSY